MNNSLPPTTSALPADAVPAGLTRLGHYELLDCIGRGGMGLVYRARDTRLDRQVAIKCLRTELFEAHYVERFKREALLLAKLNHPNIVQIYDFIEAPDQLALVMELVEGQNLQLHLREHIVPFSQRMRWLTEIAQGLAVAHDAGIIHRDLKAENILINQRKVAKITDLGIAKSQDFNATLTDHIAGSYCSMSPEQAMGEAIDFKSDLFSFGILAYQLLCGAHPFGDTNNKLQLMQRIISHPPAAPSNHNPDLPSEINDLLGQLLSKDPAKRPDNTHWVATQLETLSHLQPANDFASDDTQVLIAGGSAANQSHVKNTGIASAVRTQDHPTFETRFVAINTAPKKSYWLPIKNHLLENKISVGFGLFSVLILAAVVIWQLQPKPPKYIAVIPPKLTSEGMQESQQELVKGAVYDAIQQSVIQLDGYHLIPSSEIAYVGGDNETVRRATSADELLTTDIQCKIELCTVTMTRLTAYGKENRLSVEKTSNFDVLTDNYLSVVTISQNNTATLYSKNISNTFNSFSEQEYATLLKVTNQLRHSGASETLLDTLDTLDSNIKKTGSLQTLYREIALDIYYETDNPKPLKRLEKILSSSQNRNTEISYLYNLQSLQLAQNNFIAAEKTTDKLRILNPSQSSMNELYAHIMMSKGDFTSAIKLYKKAIEAKPSANNFYNLANAYWFTGDTSSTKKYLENSLKLAPNFYKSHHVNGLVSLLEGNITNATISFEAMFSQNPNDMGNLNNLGLCYMLAKNYQKAGEIIDKALAIAPQKLTLLLNKADIENLEGNQKKSHNLYEKIIAETRDKESSGENLRNLSQAYAHIGQISDALATLQKLEKADSQNIETAYTAALVHTLAKNNAAAIFNIENALSRGMSFVWFNFSWFDQLCAEKQFSTIIYKYGGISRCPHQQ